MESNFFALISRMRYIERWSLMRNSIHENIQEHSHMVAVIAHALGVIRRDVYGIDCDLCRSRLVSRCERDTHGRPAHAYKIPRRGDHERVQAR